ncbi:MAG: hypothetical protein IV089_03465 [Thiobacillus sp.]|nr:hypothetical protein [Thiobacillus sp.]
MADPRSELADIIVPVAPAMAAQPGGVPLWVWAAGLLAVAGVVLMMWQWRRRRFVRSLRAIAVAVARQQGTPAELSHLLDTWARARFKLTRLDAAQCPQGLDADVWAGWVNALTQLRFAPLPPSGMADLAALCATARNWKRDA